MNLSNRIIYIISFILLLVIGYIIINKTLFHKTSSKAIIKVQTNQYDIIFGNPDAANSIYMYSSYKCGFCRKFFKEVYPKLKKNYFDTGKLNLIVKPIEPNEDVDMIYALQVAISVHKYGEFDKLHELLVHNYKVVYTNDFKSLCDDFIQNNIEIAKSVLENEDYKYLKVNYQEFTDLKFSGTPSFIIDQEIHRGYKNYEEFENIIENKFQY